jgi:hypothetical protein
MSAQYLQARDVTISFDTPKGRFTAVKNINLTVRSFRSSAIRAAANRRSSTRSAALSD